MDTHEYSHMSPMREYWRPPLSTVAWIRNRRATMSNTIVSSRNVTPLHVLGTQVRFLCEAQDTGNAWSLMEVTLPLGAGPPPHKHAWDEAYFVMGGEVEFTLGKEVFTAKGGDFIYTPGG